MSNEPEAVDAERDVGVPADAEDPWVGRVLDGRYRIIERLAEGGMGAVYVAEHIGLNKEVALKLLLDEQLDNSDHGRRFVREAMVTSRIDHPNVISAIDFGTFDDGTAFLAMQLVRGPTLGAAIAKSGGMPWLRAADIGAQIADALWAAQAQGIVHRDLKPDNVILQRMPDGTDLVKLLDFGIAKFARDSMVPPAMRTTQAVTRVGVVIGTPGYMSPEQTVGKRADHRSDLYALGALLWECVIGRKLWNFDDIQKIVAAQLNKRAPSVRAQSGDSAMPIEFDSLIARLLATSAEQRPGSAAEVRDALRSLVAAAKRGTLAKDAPLVKLPPARVDSGPLVAPLPIGLLPVRPAMELATTARISRPQSPLPASLDADDARASTAAGSLALDVSQASMSASAPKPEDAPRAEGVSRSGRPPPWVRSYLQTQSSRPGPRRMFHVLSGRKQRALLGLGVVFAIWIGLLGIRGVLREERPIAPRPAAPASLAPKPSPARGMPEGVNGLLRELIDGESREQRVASAQALLGYTPADDVPEYARVMARLQVADTCPRKKQQLAVIAEAVEARTLPVLLKLAARKRTGCGPKGAEDCLGCLRDELGSLITQLEAKPTAQSAP
jgi:serine/threonine-protein kinase